jgi:serine O-acetyltransferase
VIVDDLRHLSALWDASPRRVIAISLVRSSLYPPIRAMFWIRTGMWCWRHHLRPVALWCKARAVRAAGVEIHPGATIGPGFNMAHTVGIVIGRDVVAGRDLVLHQGVTLGHDGAARGQPHLGDGVRVGAHAVVLGPVTIGDGARLGAGAIVLADVPAGATVVGLWKSV